MKKKSIIALFLALALSLTACSEEMQVEEIGQQAEEQIEEPGEQAEQQTEEQGQQAEEPEHQIEQESGQEENAPTEERALAPSPTDYVSEEEMELADMWQDSKEDSIANVMRKAERGEKVTVVVIGGSITQGTISSGSSDSSVENKRCYADIFFSWWEETFPQTEFEFINAGIGATDSYLGVHRVQSDVLDYNPDIVLVEFAVNDINSDFYKKTYDNLVRIIAKNENKPALLLLFMAQTNGACAQENQSNIGFSYSMPMVSYGNVIKEMMETGKYSENELSSDEVHPSALGHAITGEIIWKYLNSVYADLEGYGEPEPLEIPAVTQESYTNARILDSTQIKPESSRGFEEKEVFFAFPNDWTCEEGGGEIRFTAAFANFGVLYYRQIDGKGGQYEVYVDGNMEAVLDADFEGGWGNYADVQECFTSDEVKEHEIVIKEKEDSTGSFFTILGLMLSDGAGD